MIFKAHKIKDFDNIQKNRLYQINHDNKISFVEQQEDGSKDTVDIFYTIKENQQGLYANEYKPSDIGDCKVVDIFAMVYDKESIQAKMKYHNLNNTKNIEVLENFLNGIFYDGKDKIEYEICLMDKKDEKNYYTELRISME